ncbi:MAG: efflux RND transporter permease subunit [Candidatus Sumerlaeia bacterium]|nr:efflux RND transporter permease subunit [Candidatus Sumerlaeia bacterium]
MTDRLIRFCMDQKLVVLLVTAALVVWGLIVSPFNINLGPLPRHPVAVDAIPDLGENQQIVFTDWPGRSPQDVEDQVTYPLTTALLGIPGVKNVRSNSMFGFSSIYVIFEDRVEFYWSRSRIIEKLNSLPPDLLPPGVQPALGPDATGMGQIFWYTLEGRTPDGKPAGGWDLHELRSIQDWQVRYALQGAAGVAEVASVGGFVREYQVDVDPEAMRAHGVTLAEVIAAVGRSNLDVGAATIEHNRVEYVVRGRGFIRDAADIERATVATRDGLPVTVAQVATVTLGPALRRGALDKAGAEAVGGVVVARYGANPLEVIDNVKARIAEISPGLPRKTLDDGTVSQVAIVPFYDRTGLIHETIGTLESALRDQILITLIVVMLMVLHLRSSLLIGAMLPLAVLSALILMQLFGVQANVVALGGIAIAIGSVVDMGIVLCENMLQHLRTADPRERRFDVLRRAASEVGGAVLTAIATTIISFLPVFTMIGAEGKLFKPLAYTKTFALFASIAIALTVLPPLAHVLLGVRPIRLPRWLHRLWRGFHFALVLGLSLAVIVVLSSTWEPLGARREDWQNLVVVIAVVGGLLGFFWLFRHAYAPVLRWCLRFKIVFLAAPLFLVLMGTSVWLGFHRTFSWVPPRVHEAPAGQALARAFPGLGREFLPTLDEGSFLYMPVAMPHASIGEAMEFLRDTDMAMQAIPEVELVVGKLGRAESPLDPAPVSMIETIINYKSEFIQDDRGSRLTFAYDAETGEFQRDTDGNLVPDPDGRPYRNWRPHIQSPDDIWNEIVEATRFAGLTSAPQLAPIAARLVMLQSGMRAPMGVKVRGPDLATIERVGLRIEEILKQGNVAGVRSTAVIAERLVGVPYLEIVPDHDAIARFGLVVEDVMEVIEAAIGGMAVTRTVEGRERYAVRVRYARELRDSPDELGNILVDAPMVSMAGAPPVRIPLRELATIEYARGPMSIRSEDTFLVGYVLFDRQAGFPEVEVVENARAALRTQLDSELPPGVSYTFAGAYENQVRAARTLALILPLTLLLIFLILYLQFRSTAVTLLIFLNVFVAWSGGFLFLWLWAQPWFMDIAVFESNIREIFRMGHVNLSIAVWVGFLALFGIATDDGVIMATYIRQSLDNRPTTSVAEVREAIVEAARRRIRPCLMTSATTILALLPVLTSTGKGSEIMTPLAIPVFGGMLVVMVSVFVVPTLYAAIEEWKLRRTLRRHDPDSPGPVPENPNP